MSTTVSPPTLIKIYNISITSQNSFMLLFRQLHSRYHYTDSCSLPGSSVRSILQARILEWVTIPFSRGSSLPRDLARVSWFAGRSFTIWATREAPSLFLPLLICFANSRISYKWTHTWDTLPLFFGMASFTQHNYLLFFNCWMAFHCMD